MYVLKVDKNSIVMAFQSGSSFQILTPQNMYINM